MQFILKKCLVITFLIGIILSCSGVSYAGVKSLKAQTTEGLSITVWLNKSKIKSGKDVPIFFKIENLSSKKTYFVKEPNPEVYVEWNKLVVNLCTIGPDDRGPTDYQFVQIRKGKTYNGKFLIPEDKIPQDGIWMVDVELTLVDNIKGLRRTRPGEDPVLFRGLLVQRCTVITLGKLMLEVVAIKNPTVGSKYTDPT